jgi:hypothetical protein
VVPCLQQLVDETGETASFYVKHGAYRVQFLLKPVRVLIAMLERLLLHPLVELRPAEYEHAVN